MPTFSGASTIISFDAVESPQNSVLPENHVFVQLSASSKGSGNSNTPPSRLADPRGVPHSRLFFEDGNITFLVRLERSDPRFY